MLALAHEEALRFDHHYLGTEHLLLGLVREGEGVAAKVLANLDVELDRVRTAVEFMIGRGARAPTADIGPTPRARAVLELAGIEATRLGHRYISAVSRYLFDVRGGAGEAPEAVLERAAALTRQRFALLRTFLLTEDWRFAMVVDPTLDRLQHLYWDDPDLLQRHNVVIDAEIGETVARLEPADSVHVVSEHGGRAARGAFAANDWLVQEGYSRLRGTPASEPLPFERSAVDWPRAQTWAEGGSAVRIALNVQGREPEGAVEPRRYEMVRNERKRRLDGLAGPDGKTMGNRAQKPEEIYVATRRTAPDLIATLGGMAWRAVTTIGHDDLFLAPGASAAGVHADHGLFMLRWPGHSPNGRRQGIRLLDIFPTMLTTLGLPVPDDRLGHALVG